MAPPFAGMVLHPLGMEEGQRCSGLCPCEVVVVVGGMWRRRRRALHPPVQYRDVVGGPAARRAGLGDA